MRLGRRTLSVAGLGVIRLRKYTAHGQPSCMTPTYMRSLRRAVLLVTLEAPAMRTSLLPWLLGLEILAACVHRICRTTRGCTWSTRCHHKVWCHSWNGTSPQSCGGAKEMKFGFHCATLPRPRVRRFCRSTMPMLLVNHYNHSIQGSGCHRRQLFTDTFLPRASIQRRWQQRPGTSSQRIFVGAHLPLASSQRRGQRGQLRAIFRKRRPGRSQTGRSNLQMIATW